MPRRFEAEGLNTLMLEMSEPPSSPNDEFYAFTLTANEKGKAFLDVQSIWDGYADEERKVELRKARLVSMRMADVWKSAGLPVVFVHNPEHLLAFWLTGGNALVVKSVAEELAPNLLKPEPTLRIGEMGFVDKRLIDPAAFKRAPTPRLRIKVLNRDQRRCRICGRNPDDNIDIVLHVHHIRPWASQGLTDLSNLITLCHTCHAGLDPHYDPSLFSYIRGSSDEKTRAFFEGVANYRKTTSADWA